VLSSYGRVWRGVVCGVVCWCVLGASSGCPCPFGILTACSRTFFSPTYSSVWCGVVWCGVVWCGVLRCGAVWCGVVWCGVDTLPVLHAAGGHHTTYQATH